MFLSEGQRQGEIGLHLLYIYLKYFSSKNSLKTDLNGRAAKRFDIHIYDIILAKFEVSFTGDSEGIQNLPFARVACLLRGNSSP